MDGGIMKRILIVDDAFDYRASLEELFKKEGFMVSSASDGADALQQAKKEPPDLVISDILMPVMDGYTFCRKWHADQQLWQIPFVFFAGTFTEQQDIALALSLGADRFVPKH